MSSTFAFTIRATASLMKSARVGSKGTGRSTCAPFMGSDRRSFAMTSRVFFDGVRTVRRIPARRAAVDNTRPLPRMLDASNMTTSPGRSARNAISASTEDAPGEVLSASYSSGALRSNNANSRRFFSSNASDVTTSLSAWNCANDKFKMWCAPSSE